MRGPVSFAAAVEESCARAVLAVSGPSKSFKADAEVSKFRNTRSADQWSRIDRGQMLESSMGLRTLRRFAHCSCVRGVLCMEKALVSSSAQHDVTFNWKLLVDSSCTSGESTRTARTSRSPEGRDKRRPPEVTSASSPVLEWSKGQLCSM